MRIDLTAADLATILNALPNLPCERIDVRIDGGRVLITLCKVDYLGLVPKANAMVRMALATLPNDMPLWLCGTRSDDDSVHMQWGFDHAAFDMVKRFGAGQLVLEQVFSSCPEAAQERDEDSFRLVLRNLPAPMPALLTGWNLSAAELPYDAQFAVSLVAHPG